MVYLNSQKLCHLVPPVLILLDVLYENILYVIKQTLDDKHINIIGNPLRP